MIRCASGSDLGAAATSAQAEKPIALVIGNGAYVKVPRLPNPTSDSAAMASLQRSSIVVMSREDPKQRAALAAFEQSAKELESTAAEVVHAGHALFKDGEPTDPALQRRYRLYKDVEATLAQPDLSA
jgi:predicted alpha/beta hydrolase family esterase